MKTRRSASALLLRRGSRARRGRLRRRRDVAGFGLGFLVTVRHEVKAPPPRLYAALGEIDRWWNGSHSYSGQAANLSLARQAGGCFCERWGNNSVEHARVVIALEDRMLRLEGALGPLQALAVNGVLDLRPGAEGRRHDARRHLPGRRQRGGGTAAARRAGGRRDRRAGAAPGRLRRDRQARSEPRLWRPSTRPGAGAGRRAGSRSARRRSSAPARRGAGCRPRTPGSARHRLEAFEVDHLELDPGGVVVGEQADDAVEVGLAARSASRGSGRSPGRSGSRSCTARRTGVRRASSFSISGGKSLAIVTRVPVLQVEAEDDVVEHLRVASSCAAANRSGSCSSSGCGRCSWRRSGRPPSTPAAAR